MARDERNLTLHLLILTVSMAACTGLQPAGKSAPSGTVKALPSDAPSGEAVQDEHWNIDPSSPTSIPIPSAGPELSNQQISECRKGDPDVRMPKVGELAIDFTLTDLAGYPVSLSQSLREKPVMLILGSFT